MPIETFILFLFTTAIVVFSPGAAAIAVASQGATNGGRRALDVRLFGFPYNGV